MDINQLTVYQIYPKSFNDSDGDGIGDIQGIIDKLDYLAELGVNCLWLTPIYPSPQKDNGYDVADYTAINPTYGTMADFDQLIAEAKARDIMLMLDMVFNHSSDQHPWFQQALAGDPLYREYYVFKTAHTPPTNWVSKFGGSVWEPVSDTGSYYLHLFDKTQPDLNWENPQLRQEVYDILNFWLEKGIRGFRLDVINLISKGDYVDDHQGDGRRFYTDGPKIHDYLKEMHQQTFANYTGTVTVGEMSSTTLAHCVRYSNPAEKELDMTFSFHHLKVDYVDGEKWSDWSATSPDGAKFDFMALKKLLFDWQIGMAARGGHNALFWCNHDQPRAISRFGNETLASGQMLATALHLLKGTPYIYQGEELGMTNANFTTIDQYRDVESLNYYHILQAQGKPEDEILHILRQKSRDNSRTPMQWDGSAHSGFTTGTPWIQVIDNYPSLNAEQVVSNPASLFHHYKQLVSLRKTQPVIAQGSFEPVLADHPQVFAYLRKHEGQSLLVVNNFFDQVVAVTPTAQMLAFAHAPTLISNQPDRQWHDVLTLRPYESFGLLLG